MPIYLYLPCGNANLTALLENHVNDLRPRGRVKIVDGYNRSYYSRCDGIRIHCRC